MTTAIQSAGNATAFCSDFDQQSAQDTLISRDATMSAIRTALRRELFFYHRMTVDDLARQAKVPPRAIRSFVEQQDHDLRLCPLNYLLSISVVLGPRFENTIRDAIGLPSVSTSNWTREERAA